MDRHNCVSPLLTTLPRPGGDAKPVWFMGGGISRIGGKERPMLVERLLNQSASALNLDDRADMLTIESLGQVARYEGIDDLDFSNVRGIEHVFQNNTLHHQIVKIHSHQLSDADTRDESCGRVFLRVLG